MNYPRVFGEFRTIAMVTAGYSLARLGDGELKIIHGAGYSREPINPALTAELRSTFLTPHPRCLIGIPTMDSHGPKYENWTRHAARFNAIAVPGATYVSAFVTRPDSAPWIQTRRYALKVQAIWAGRRAAVVCEETGSMLRTVRRAAASVTHILCPHALAYAVIDELEQRVVDSGAEVAILSAGPTATCLANRLAARGIQGVDLGSAGQFLGKLLAS